MDMSISEEPISDVCSKHYIGSGPELVLPSWFKHDDLIQATTAGVGSPIHTFGEIQNNLDAYSAININPVARGEVAPKRERVAVKIHSWPCLSLLAREAELSLVFIGGRDGSLHGVFDCSRWQPSKLKRLALTTLRLGGSVVDTIPMPGGRVATLNDTAYSMLSREAFIRDSAQFKARNHILLWRESLPVVPPKGRSS